MTERIEKAQESAPTVKTPEENTPWITPELENQPVEVLAKALEAATKEVAELRLRNRHAVSVCLVFGVCSIVGGMFFTYLGFMTQWHVVVLLSLMLCAMGTIVSMYGVKPRVADEYALWHVSPKDTPQQHALLFVTMHTNPAHPLTDQADISLSLRRALTKRHRSIALCTAFALVLLIPQITFLVSVMLF